MTEFRARIGRVRMKGGGADVVVIDREATNPDDENWCGKVVQNARSVAEQSTPESPLIGYILIGFYSDGATSVGFRYDPERCAIPRALMPAWISEIVRREMITAPEAEAKFNVMFEWQDGR